VDDACGQVRLVVGLGNPGPAYRRTRHNVGFMVLTALRERWDFGRGRSKFHARLWRGAIGGRATMLLAPQTYMNRSGLAVSEAAAFYKIAADRMLVVMDDMALPLGRLRARARGSAGGHKGLGDVMASLGVQTVPRLRIGIGPPDGLGEAVDHVLAKFAAGERPVIDQAVRRAADAVEHWASKGITYVMDHYNQDTNDNVENP